MSRARVVCPRDGEVIVETKGLVIDDEDHVYRFTCPRCALPIEKQMDDAIREILRGAFAPTLDELVASGASVLANDANIWRELLKT
jgi:hypothetical protein